MKDGQTEPTPRPAEAEDDQALIEQALRIAVDAHRGQKDRYGAPYILHPLRVLARVRTDAERVVAVLHDVVEDTNWTLAGLAAAGFPERIVTAVDCLTKREGESYPRLIERAGENALARAVKLADLEDNLDVRRCRQVTAVDTERLARYHAAWQALNRGA